ncbi:hypothetical protein CsatA_005852 [Cannabis sativa]
MAKKRVQMAPSMADDDRISKLPDALITHILSFLPTKEVVQTCLLSKRWKLIWYSVPTLLFYNYDMDDLEKLYNFINKYLKRRKKGMKFIADSGVTSFVLRMNGTCKRSKTRLLGKWLAFAVEKKIKEIKLKLSLDLMPHDWDSIYYCLPKILLVNARYLTILELEGIMLDTFYPFNFPSLKSLSLRFVYHSSTATDDGVFKFLLGSPSLEKLCLDEYDFLRINDQIQLQSLSLKFLELIYLELDRLELHVQVEAINLESLVLCGVALHEIDLSSCKKIRNISLEECTEDDHSSLQALISNNPLLENLTLRYCLMYNSKHLNISSQHLKSFDFTHFRCDEDEMISAVTIESAPKLTSFHYDGDIDLSISIKSHNLLNGKIVILEEQEVDYDTRFPNMMKFLSKLNCSWNIITLHVCKDEALILPKNVKKMDMSPLISWKHLRVIINEYNPERLSDLKNSLLWISPSLETLSINGNVIF